jgi:CBS domain-containing protein
LLAWLAFLPRVRSRFPPSPCDPVARVAADATVADVARALVTADVGAIVVGDDARPAALVGERDVIRVVAAGKDPASVPATDIASTTLVWCGPEETVDRVAVRMMDHYIRHVLVERNGARSASSRPATCSASTAPTAPKPKSIRRETYAVNDSAAGGR